MEIRAIAQKDLKPISQLYVSVFTNPPWNEDWEYEWAYERLNWVYQCQDFVGLVSLNDSKINGAILGYFIPFRGKKGFKLAEFFVDTNYQNKGIGIKLLTQLELYLKQNNYDFISLLTAKNTDAESFYLNRYYQRDDRLVLLRREI